MKLIPLLRVVVVPFSLIWRRPPSKDLRALEGLFKLPHISTYIATFAALRAFDTALSRVQSMSLVSCAAGTSGR